MSMPGTILSQLGINTSASKPWAMAMHSTASAINLAAGQAVAHSDVAHGDAVVDAGNVELEGRAAAPRMPAFTASAMRRRWVWPGMISL